MNKQAYMYMIGVDFLLFRKTSLYDFVVVTVADDVTKLSRI